MNLDLHLVEKISHLLHGNFIVNGDFLRQSAGNLPILGRFIQLGGNFFLLQDSNPPLEPFPSPLREKKVMVGKIYDTI